MALSAPVADGDQLNPVDINGHTLVVCPTEFIEHIQTKHTKPGEKSPAIRVNVAVLSQNTEGGGHPIYRGVLWFNVKLYNGLKRQIGETILGRMSQGVGTQGNNPPWQLENMLTDPGWSAYAEQWLATPAGQEFEAEAITEVNRAAAANAQQAETAPPASNVGSVPPPSFGQQGPPALPNIPPTPPAGLAPPSAPPAPPVAPQVPAAPAAPVAAAPTGGVDFAAMFAGLPADEQAKMMALMQQQGQASS